MKNADEWLLFTYAKPESMIQITCTPDFCPEKSALLMKSIRWVHNIRSVIEGFVNETLLRVPGQSLRNLTPGKNLHGTIAEKGVVAFIIPLFLIVKGIVVFQSFIREVETGFPVAGSRVKFFSECQPEIPEAFLITAVPADVCFYIFIPVECF